jgi:hypothetical protein
MINVFISYRRLDKGWAGRINDDLKSKTINVFRDVNDIPIGAPFPQYIENAIDESHVVLVVIGRTWQERLSELHNPDDWVRRELIFAYKMDKLIIPIQVDDIPMPQASDLPMELRWLSFRNGKPFSDPTAKSDARKVRTWLLREFKDNTEKKEWTTLNALRSALYLVRHHVTGTSMQVEEMRNLMNFITSNNNLTDNIENFSVKPNLPKQRLLKDYERLLLPGVHYVNQPLTEKVNLQIAIKNPNTSVTLVLFSQVIFNTNSIRVLLIEFNSMDIPVLNDVEIRKILKHINEPELTGSVDYRLPYISFFNGKIRSKSEFRHHYIPYKQDTHIDSEMFTDLFKLKWIGSKDIEIDQLISLRDHLSSVYQYYTIIHAIEYEAPQIL